VVVVCQTKLVHTYCRGLPNIGDGGGLRLRVHQTEVVHGCANLLNSSNVGPNGVGVLGSIIIEDAHGGGGIPPCNCSQ